MMKKVLVVGFVSVVLVACGGGAATAEPRTAGAGGGAAAPGGATTTAGDGAGSAGGSQGATPNTDAPPPSKTPVGPQLSELEAKRVIALVNEEMPEHKKKLKEICGTDIDIQIDWASFGRDKVGLERLRGNWGVQLLVDSFRKVCKDQLGKDAVKAKIKTVKAINVADKANVKATVAGGAFTAELTWSGSSPGMNENDLGAVITKAL